METEIPKKLVNFYKNEVAGVQRKSENPGPMYRRIWHRKRLETRRCTVCNTVQYCTGGGDKEYREYRPIRME